MVWHHDRKMAANETSGALRNKHTVFHTHHKNTDKMPPKFIKSSEKELVRLHIYQSFNRYIGRFRILWTLPPLS